MSSRIRVRVPLTRAAERRYVIGEVFGRMLGLEFDIEADATVTTTVVTAPGAPGALIFEDDLFATPDDKWLQPASVPELPLPEWHLDLPDRSSIPLLFGTPRLGGHPGDPEALVVGADLLGGVFFLLTGYEEQAGAGLDGHGRFLGATSILGRSGLVDIPLADVYADVVWHLLTRVWPGLRRLRRHYQLRLTCDVDHAFGIHGRTPRQVCRRVAHDLVRKKAPARAAQRLAMWPPVATGRLERDPNNTMRFMMSVAERHGLSMTFYFPAGLSRHERDALHGPTYPPIVDLMREIGGRGHSVGLHPSYASFGDVGAIRRELEVLLQACATAGLEEVELGGRQHYLRWTPDTWQAYEQLGLAYDSSMGFPDLPGFRAGSAGPFGTFDLRQSRPLDVVERPLHLMDVTVLGYQGQHERQLAERAGAIAEVVRRFNGTMTLLWHNDQLVGSQRRHFRAAVEAAA